MSLPNEFNPVSFHKQIKTLLMETNWVEIDVPIAVLYLILKYTANHGEGLQVRLKCVKNQNFFTLFHFLRYDNVMKRTVRLHIPSTCTLFPHGLMIVSESEIITKEE